MSDGWNGAPLRTRLGVAIAGSYLYRVLAAALLASPLVSIVSGSGIRSFPRGDARLFDPGGLYLIEVFVRSRELLAETAAPTVMALLVLGALGLVPEWWLLGALWPSTPPVRRLPRLLGLAAVTWGARLLLGLLTLGLALTARSYFASARDERLPAVAVGVVVGIGLLLQAALSFWHDLAEVDVVAADAAPRAALSHALDLARVSGAGLLARYAGAQLLGLGALLGAAAAVGALDVARGESWRSAGALALHQLVVLLGIALRAAWLWSARRASISLPGR